MANHGFFLIFFFFQSFLQFLLSLGNLRFLFADLRPQAGDIRFYLLQIAVKLCHIIFQVGALPLQILFHFFQVTQTALQCLLFFLCLFNLLFLLSDAV